MDVALEVWSSDLDQLIKTSERADALGFHALYYGESPGGLNLDCFTTLGVLAAHTEQIRLGPVIACFLDDYRSTALLGKQAATVAAASRGRFDFRTGAGAARPFGTEWWAPVGVDYPAYETRLARLARTLPLLRSYWAGEAVDFGGSAPTTLGFDCPPIPLTIAATGARAVEIAVRAADCWEISFATPDEISARLGREPMKPQRLSLEIDGIIGTTRAASARVERSLRRDRKGEDIDRLLGRALRGTPDDVAEQLGELALVGVDQVVVALHDPHQADALEALAEAMGLVDSDGR